MKLNILLLVTLVAFVGVFSETATETSDANKESKKDSNKVTIKGNPLFCTIQQFGEKTLFETDIAADQVTFDVKETREEAIKYFCENLQTMKTKQPVQTLVAKCIKENESISKINLKWKFLNNTNVRHVQGFITIVNSKVEIFTQIDIPNKQIKQNTIKCHVFTNKERFELIREIEKEMVPKDISKEKKLQLEVHLNMLKRPKKSNSKTFLFIICGIIGGLILIGGCVLFVNSRKKTQNASEPQHQRDNNMV